jgi:hypothetical protein
MAEWASMGDRRNIPIPFCNDPLRRTVPRRAVEELLLVSGCLFELREGAQGSAMSAVRLLLDQTPGRLLDPDEVINSMIAQGLSGQSDFWRSRCVATGRRLVGGLCGSVADGPPDIFGLSPKPFRVEFRRTFDLTRSPAKRLRMPLPFEGPHLTDLEVAIEESSAEVRMNSGRLEAKVTGGERGRFTLAASFSFLARPGLPHGLETGPIQPETWLADKEGPIQVTRAVAALADRLAGSRRDPFDRVVAFRDHLIDTMTCGRVQLDRLDGQAGTDWVLANRWFDCRLGAALLVALCRASHIPARLVGGYPLWDASSEHYWMEAWLPDRGWTSFDLLAWDLSAGGRDEAWRNIYVGAVDYRMKTQVFPHIFTGAPGVPMGAAWHRLLRATPDGSEASLVAIPDGELIYADTVGVFTD